MTQQKAPEMGASVGAKTTAEPDTVGQGGGRGQGLPALVVALVPDWLTPNHLTCLRMLGSFIILAVGLSHAHLGWIVALGLVSGLSDNLDGMVARVRGQVTELGAMLDPLADKLFAGVLMVVLWWRDLADWRLLALAAAMDLHAVLLPLMIIYRRRRQGRPLRPAPRVQTNTWGKLKTAVVAWSMGLIVLGNTFDLPWMARLGTGSIWVGVALGLVALERYFAAFRAGNFD